MASPPRRLPPANQDHQQLTGQSGTQSASSLPEHEGSVASEWAQLDQASVAGSFSMPPSADPGSDPVLARLLQSHRQAYPISSNAHSTGQLASVPPITPVLSSIGFDVQGTAASQYNFVQGEQQQRSAEKQHQHSAESQQGADIDAESSTDDYENNDFSNLFSDEPNENSRDEVVDLSEPRPSAERRPNDAYQRHPSSSLAFRSQYLTAPSQRPSAQKQQYEQFATQSRTSKASLHMHEFPVISPPVFSSQPAPLQLAQGSHLPANSHAENRITARPSQQNPHRQAAPSAQTQVLTQTPDRDPSQSTALSQSPTSASVTDVAPTPAIKGKRGKGRNTVRDNPPTRKRHANTGLFFNNHNEATRVPYTDLDWKFPENDPTLPQTNAEEQAWVKKLFQAFMNRDDILDKNTGPVVNARWLQQRANGTYCDYYGEDNVERVCWDVLHIIIKMYTEGLQWVPVLDKETWSKGYKESELSFKERMKALIKLFNLFKNRCDKMMKGENRYGTILAPLEACKTAESNRGANDKRHNLLHMGRDAQKVEDDKKGKAAGGTKPSNKRRSIKNRNRAASPASPVSPVSPTCRPSPPTRTPEGYPVDDARAEYNHQPQTGISIPNLGQYPDQSHREALNHPSAWQHASPNSNSRRPMTLYNAQQSIQGGNSHQSPPAFYNGRVDHPYMHQHSGSQAQSFFPNAIAGGYGNGNTSLQSTQSQDHLQAPAPRLQSFPSQTMVHNTGASLTGAGQAPTGAVFGGHQEFAENIGQSRATLMSNISPDTPIPGVTPPRDQGLKRASGSDLPFGGNDGGQNNPKRRRYDL